MQITNDNLNEFIVLYRAEFGKDISQKDALVMATRLVNLYLIVYHPISGECGDRPMWPSEDRRDHDASFPNAE
jgi:hypothetical protein